MREVEGVYNGAANWATPLAPFTGTFPSFVPYSSTTALSLFTFANNLRPPVVQHFSLNTQTALTKNTVLELGYLGTRAQHILIVREPDQALSASPSNPIRGQTTNTQANISLRLPVQGFSPATFSQSESTGGSWYHALLANFTQRFKDGSEAQIAYTWSKSLSDSAAASTGPNGGTRVGDQNNPRADYGPDQFNRPQRLVANFTYLIPTPFHTTSLLGEVLGGWGAMGVVTLQSGHNLYVTNTNVSNAFGISGEEQDFAELTPSCLGSQIGTGGSVTSRLNNYFNKSCFTATLTVVGSGGATGFGNSRPGLLRGPAQNNLDFALRKEFALSMRREPVHAEFRAELFNAFNTPQFSDPGTAFDQPTFGIINTTSVDSRIMQLAIKFSF